MNTRSLTESLYNKYGKYDLSNVGIKSNKNKPKSKKLHEDFDFENENKDLYNKFVEIAERYGFAVTSSGMNYINFKTFYDDYTLEVTVDVDDFDKYDTEITFESIVYLPGGDPYGSEDNFDNLEAAIAWGEEIIAPRAQLLRNIRKLIND